MPILYFDFRLMLLEKCYWRALRFFFQMLDCRVFIDSCKEWISQSWHSIKDYYFNFHICPESGRPLRQMGHSFRVLIVDGYYSAGRTDLLLLSGDAFSVYNEYNTQIVRSTIFYRSNNTMRCISKECINYPEFAYFIRNPSKQLNVWFSA